MGCAPCGAKGAGAMPCCTKPAPCRWHHAVPGQHSACKRGGVGCCACAPPRSRERAAAWSVPPVEGAGGGHHWSLPPWGWVPVAGPPGAEQPLPSQGGGTGGCPPTEPCSPRGHAPLQHRGGPGTPQPPPPCAATGLRGAVLPLPLAVPGGARGAGWGPPGRAAGAGSAGAAAGLRPRGVRCFRGDIYSQRQRQRLQRGSCSL